MKSEDLLAKMALGNINKAIAELKAVALAVNSNEGLRQISEWQYVASYCATAATSAEAAAKILAGK